MPSANKDTIYVDIDDEITGIIDKVQASSGKVVALVLPKRAAVFQSIVNMKLLKRAADSGKKNLVLITSEAGLLPLAGAAGIHVAKTLTSKPEIPGSPDMNDDEEEVDEDEVAELPPEDDEPLDAQKSVGQLAGTSGAAAAADDVETLTLDNDDELPEDNAKPAAKKDFKPPKKDKKLKVPDFDRFRLLMILGGLILILLIFFMIFAIKVLPKATISLKTDAQSIDLSVPLNLATTATKVSTADNTIPAKLAQLQKTYTQQVPTTGQKNNGNKASGQVTITSCNDDGSGVTIPAGTGISANGQTYITQSTVSTEESLFQGKTCRTFPSTSASVNVLAQSPGSSFNITAGSSMQVAGYSNVNAKSGPISGGTDNIVHSVNQNDITNAKSKIQLASDNDMKKTLKSQLSKDNYYAIEATYSSGTPAISPSADVGTVADTVTVTETVTYTMFGVHKNELRVLVGDAIKSQIDTSKQSVLDDGIDSASYNIDNLTASGGKITMSGTATAGPDLDTDSIRQNALGKKPAEIKSSLESYPGVQNVDVKLSPFWVSSVPHKSSKVKVEIAKPTTNKSSSTNGSN